MKKKICFIGNDSLSNASNDGQTLKIRLYKSIFSSEKIDYEFINLHNWHKRIFSIMLNLSKQIKQCDIIFLMAGPRGSRRLIPLINFLNKRHKKRFICSMIGRGTLSIPVDSHYINSDDFFIKHNYHNLKDDNIKRNLKKLNAIFLETETLTSTYSDFYSLENCYTIYNFRKIDLKNKRTSKTPSLRLGYFSRVCRYKGIFDLLDAFKMVAGEGRDLELDIYGNKEFDQKDSFLFDDYLSSLKEIHYHGSVPHENVLEAMQECDCFIFPSICSEGMPGSVIESLIIGLPLISSRFTQSKDILTHGFDSLIYDAGNVNQLADCIRQIYADRELLHNLSINASITGKKFTYEFNKKRLFELIGL